MQRVLCGVILALLAGPAMADDGLRYYVLNLPACDAGREGVDLIVRDALQPIKGEPVVGLGPQGARVICEAGVWKVKNR